MEQTTLSGIDHATLTPIVRAALEKRSAEIVDWQVTPITQGRASAAGVYRVTGSAMAQGKTHAWSLIVKDVSASALSALAGNHSTDDITSNEYWKREVLLYQSGLFDDLPTGIRAPHCYRIDEQDRAARIWMEDVRDDIGVDWPLKHYAQVGRHFGRFNGLFLAERPIPDWPWLMQSYFTRWLDTPDWLEFKQQYPALRREDALVRRGWSDDLFNDIEQLWQDRIAFVQTLARLPQTLHHNDSGRKNLVAHQRADGDVETVALDWGQAATGPVGGELACIVMQPIYWFHGVHPEQLSEMDEIIFDAYVQGLRDMGWDGATDLVRFGYTASIALRGAFGIFNFEWAARNESTRVFIENGIGHASEEIADVMRGLRTYLIACAAEARQLMTSQALATLPS